MFILQTALKRCHSLHSDVSLQIGDEPPTQANNIEFPGETRKYSHLEQSYQQNWIDSVQKPLLFNFKFGKQHTHQNDLAYHRLMESHVPYLLL